MRALRERFSAHPRSVGESYGRHFAVALSFAGTLAGAALACLVHAFLPFLFTRTGSDAIRSLHRRMVTHRDRRLPGDDAASRAAEEAGG